MSSVGPASWSIEERSSNSSNEDRLRSRKCQTNLTPDLRAQTVIPPVPPHIGRVQNGRLHSRSGAWVFSNFFVFAGIASTGTFYALQQWARSSPTCQFILRFSRRQGRLVSLAVVILVIQIVYNPLSARRVDHYFTFGVMASRFRAQEHALLKAGVVLPRTKVDFANVINTHAALRELLIRREQRSRTLQSLERVASSRCLNQPHACPSTIPKVIFVPSVFRWEPPRPGAVASHNFTLLRYDETEMRQLIQDVAVVLHPSATQLIAVYDRLDAIDKIQLWSLCAVYLFGGIFVGSSLFDETIDGDVIFGKDSFVHHGVALDPTAIAVVERNGTETQESIRFLAATPRHVLLGCLLLSLKDSNYERADGIVRRIFLLNRGAGLHTPFAQLPLKPTIRDSWQRWSPHNNLCGIDSCPVEMESSPVTHDILRVQDWATEGCALYTRLVSRKGPTDGIVTRRTVSVQIDEAKADTTSTGKRAKHAKIPLQSQMRKRGFEPGWVCNRCLNFAALGTYDKCKRFCPDGYKELMCDTADLVEKTPVVVNVIVRGSSAAVTVISKAIPRIIHQTWIEEITFDRYPQLARLQASWKNSGWDYRFYTDETARDYIVEYFPSRFVEAFDALIHGAYKADLFRYMVLMREGGVYADVDVKLETSLDDFISPSMSFFASRDVPCEYAGEAYCLWNGFIGASPGNPIIVRAVERLINLIEERSDMYDMERESCRRSGSEMQVWKVRAQPLLFLSGPCALGVAMNEALHRAPLGSLSFGWIGLEPFEFGGRLDNGDVLVLIGDKYDLGEFRISQPDNGVIVAATDIEGLDKSPRKIKNPTEGEVRRFFLRHKPLPHYSNSKRGVSVWGTANVYRDSLVANENIRIRVQFID